MPNKRKQKRKLSHLVPVPSKWDCKSPEEVMTFLNEDSKEYDKVKKLVNLDNITDIYRVENTYLYGRYLLKKKMYELKGYRERILLHATYPENALSIANNNFNYRLVKRCKYGKGVSFTPKPTYANKEGCHSVESEERAMIVTKVLVGKAIHGSYATKIPPSSFDTTVSGHSAKKNDVYVKYYDDEFYPEYVVFYDYYK